MTGGRGGSGGTAELSDARFVLEGVVDTTATEGRAGSFLLDPQDILNVDPAVTGADDSPTDYSDSGDGNASTIPAGPIIGFATGEV